MFLLRVCMTDVGHTPTNSVSYSFMNSSVFISIWRDGIIIIQKKDLKHLFGLGWYQRVRTSWFSC